MPIGWQYDARARQFMRPTAKKSPYSSKLLSRSIIKPLDSSAGPARAANAAATARIGGPKPPGASQFPAALATAPSPPADTLGVAAHRANRPDSGHRGQTPDKAIASSRDGSRGT